MPFAVPDTVAPEFPRSELPAGGSPSDDRAYRAWRDGLLADFDERRRARAWHASAELMPVEPHQLDRHLFHAIDGGLLPSTWNHMIRALGIALRTRRRAVLAAAARYLDGIDDDV